MNHSKAPRFPWHNADDNRTTRCRRPVPLFVVLVIALLGATCAVGSALIGAHASSDSITVSDLVHNPNSSDGHGKLIRVEGQNVAYCAQGFLSYPEVGQKLTRYGSPEIPELDYVVYHGYDGKVVTSVAGLDKGKSESATMAAIWLAIGDKRPDLLNFVPKYDPPWHGNKAYKERWEAIKDPQIKEASWNLYQQALSYAQAGEGGIEAGCAILWVNRTPKGENKTFGYQSLITSEKKTRVVFSKTSADASISANNGEYTLEGAEYTIYHASDSSTAGTITTDANGHAELALKPNTTYYALETKAPKGFAKNAERIEFTTTGLNTLVSAADKPCTFSLLVCKYDAVSEGAAQTGCSFEGAEYELTSDSTPGFYATATTNKEGAASFENIPLGTIHVRETKAPQGYLLDTEDHIYHVGADDLDENATLKLTPESDFDEIPLAFDIEIAKFKDEGDEGSSKQEVPAEGVTFQIISNTTGKTIGSITTDKDGYATSKGLWFGCGSNSDVAHGAIPYDPAGYTIHEDEQTIPDGFAAIDDWTINAAQMIDGCTLKYIINNHRKMSRLQIVKVDAESGERIPLAGFSFQLLDSNKNLISQNVWYPAQSTIDTFTTGDDGSVTLPEQLAAGTYYIREISAARPYVLSGEDTKIEIDGDEPLCIATVANSPVTGIAQIVKTCSEDSAALGDAEFDVRVHEDVVSLDGSVLLNAGTVVDHVKTNDQGRATTSKLLLGAGEATYEFVETKPAPGHALATGPIVFTLSYENQNTPLVSASCAASNMPTTVEIKKVKAGSDAPVPGVQFTLWRLEDEEASDPSGPAENDTADEVHDDTRDIPQLKEGCSTLTVTTDQEGACRAIHLQPGIWRIKETSTANGFLLDPLIREFTVDEHGLIDGGASYQVVIENDFTKVDVSKRDITNESELAGAHLTATDSDGNIVDEWTSTTEPHRIEALAPGSYTLTETQSPQGHDVAESITFTVEESGEIQAVAMYDRPIQINGEIDKRQQRLTEAGEGHIFTYSLDMRNTSNTWVDECTVTDPLDCVTQGMAEVTSVTTPIVQGDYDGKLNVWYQLSNDDDYLNESDANATIEDDHENPWLEGEGRKLDYSHWHLWEQNVDATQTRVLNVSDLDLKESQHICALRFEFGCVADSFTTRKDGWDRSGIKNEDDSYDKHSDEMGAGDLSPAIIQLSTTKRWAGGSTLLNSATIDLYRNGGGPGLEDHDEDKVKQIIGRPLAQTGVDSDVIPLLAGMLCGFAVIAFALFPAISRKSIRTKR